MMKVSKFFAPVQELFPVLQQKKEYVEGGCTATMNKASDIIHRYFSKNESDLKAMVDEVYKIIYESKNILSDDEMASIATWATFNIFQRIKDSGCAHKETNLMELVTRWFSLIRHKKHDSQFLSCVSVIQIANDTAVIQFNFPGDVCIVNNTYGSQKSFPINDFNLSTKVDDTSDITTLVGAYFWNLLSTTREQKARWLLPFTKGSGVENSLLGHFTSGFANEETPELREKMQKLFRSVLEGKLVVPRRGDISDGIATHIIDGLGIQSDSPDEKRKMVNLFFQRANEHISTYKNCFLSEIEVFAGNVRQQKSCVQTLLRSAEEEREMWQSEAVEAMRRESWRLTKQNTLLRKYGIIQRQSNSRIIELEGIELKLEMFEKNGERVKKFLERSIINVEDMTRIYNGPLFERIKKNVMDAWDEYSASLINRLAKNMRHINNLGQELLSSNNKEKINYTGNINVALDAQVSLQHLDRKTVFLRCLDKLKPIIDGDLSKDSFDVDRIYEQVTNIVSDGKSELEKDDKYAIATWAAISIFNGIKELDNNRNETKALNLIKLLNAWLSFMKHEPYHHQLYSYFLIKDGNTSFDILFKFQEYDDVEYNHETSGKGLIPIEEFQLLKIKGSQFDMMAAAEISFLHLLRMIVCEDYQSLSPFSRLGRAAESLFERFAMHFCEKESKSINEKNKRIFQAIWQGECGISVDSSMSPLSPASVFQRVVLLMDFGKYEDIDERYEKINTVFKKISDYISTESDNFSCMMTRFAGRMSQHIGAVSALRDTKRRAAKTLRDDVTQQKSANLLGRVQYTLFHEASLRTKQEKLARQIGQLGEILSLFQMIMNRLEIAQANLKQAIKNVNFVKTQCNLHMAEEKASRMRSVIADAGAENFVMNQSEQVDSANADKPGEATDSAKEKKNPILAFFQRILSSVMERFVRSNETTAGVSSGMGNGNKEKKNPILAFFQRIWDWIWQ